MGSKLSSHLTKPGAENAARKMDEHLQTLRDIKLQFQDPVKAYISDEKSTLPYFAEVEKSVKEQETARLRHRLQSDESGGEMTIQDLHIMCGGNSNKDTFRQIESLVSDVVHEHQSVSNAIQRMTSLFKTILLEIQNSSSASQAQSMYIDYLTGDMLDSTSQATTNKVANGKRVIEDKVVQAENIANSLKTELLKAESGQPEKIDSVFEGVTTFLELVKENSLRLLNKQEEQLARTTENLQQAKLNMTVQNGNHQIAGMCNDTSDILSQEDVITTQASVDLKQSVRTLKTTDIAYKDMKLDLRAIFSEELLRKMEKLDLFDGEIVFVKNQSVTKEGSWNDHVSSRMSNVSYEPHDTAQLISEEWLSLPETSSSSEVFEFPIDAFISLVNSGKKRSSLLFPLVALKSFLQGTVWFLRNGNLELMINHSCRGRAAQTLKSVTYKAVATNNSKKKVLDQLEVTRTFGKVMGKDGWEVDVKMGQMTIPCHSDLHAGIVIIFIITWKKM